MSYHRALLFTLLLTSLSIPVGCGTKSSPQTPAGAVDTSDTANDTQRQETDPEHQIAELPQQQTDPPDLTIPNLTEPETSSDSQIHSAEQEKTSAEVPDAGRIDGFPPEHSAGDVVEFSPEKKTTRDDQVVIIPRPGSSTDEPIAPPSPPNQEQPAKASPTDVDSGIIRRDGLTKEHQGFSTEHVFFATNRDPMASAAMAKDPDLFFGDERGDLSYGICEVSIPYRRAPGSLPGPSILKLEFSQDPAKHIVLMEIERLPDAAFWKALRAKVDASPHRQLMLFVHGYCATFRDAARRTAQMAYDMNYQGPLCFSAGLREVMWKASQNEQTI